jgi:hypothetical protein
MVTVAVLHVEAAQKGVVVVQKGNEGVRLAANPRESDQRSYRPSFRPLHVPSEHPYVEQQKQYPYRNPRRIP